MAATPAIKANAAAMITEAQSIARRLKAWDTQARDAAIEVILSRVAGGESLRQVLRDKGMPGAATWFKWLADCDVTRKRYAQAREALADCVADDILDIADTATDSDSASAARVRVEARRWFAGKVKPGTYGDNVGLDLQANGGITISLQRYAPPLPLPESEGE